MPRIDSLFRFVGNKIKIACLGIKVGQNTVVPVNNLINLSAGNGLAMDTDPTTASITLRNDSDREMEMTALGSRGVWANGNTYTLTPDSWLQQVVTITIPANNTGHTIWYKLSLYGTYSDFADAQGNETLGFYIANSGWDSYSNYPIVAVGSCERSHTKIFKRDNGAGQLIVYGMAKASIAGKFSNAWGVLEPIAWY